MAGYNSGQPKPRPLADDRNVRLPDAVGERFGYRNCPCCGTDMSFAKPKKGRPTASNKATVGHDVAVARGGHRGAWYYQCNRCNNDQGVLDLVTWARKLVHNGDRRADRVVAVAAFVRGFIAAWRGASDEEAA